MKALERHLSEIERYEGIVLKSKNPYVINDYSKAIRRLKGELKTYCHLRGFDYNKLLKNYKKCAKRHVVR